MIFGNARAALPDVARPDWKAEDQRRSRARTSAGNSNEGDNQIGDMPSWMFKEESKREETKNRDSKKKPVLLKKNNNSATQDAKVQEGTAEVNCVAGPVLTRAQAKNTDKIYPLKVEEAMSGVNKSTIEDLQKDDSTLKKCFDQVGKPIIRENDAGEFFVENGLLYWKHQETKTGKGLTST